MNGSRDAREGCQQRCGEGWGLELTPRDAKSWECFIYALPTEKNGDIFSEIFLWGFKRKRRERSINVECSSLEYDIKSYGGTLNERQELTTVSIVRRLLECRSRRLNSPVQEAVERFIRLICGVPVFIALDGIRSS